MSRVLVSEENLTNIANSIRAKFDTDATYKPGQMSTAIAEFRTAGIKLFQNLVSRNITAVSAEDLQGITRLGTDAFLLLYKIGVD